MINRVLYLDGWRGFAVLAVLFAHFITPNYLNLGRFGVELFFVLSGRLMAELLFVKNTPLSLFFPRRFSRVYPALFVFLTIMLIMSVVFEVGKISVVAYLSSITFTLNYVHLFIGRPAIIGHIWSLCIEEHIYIVLGLLAYFHRKRSLPVISILISLILIASVIGTTQTALGYDYYTVYWRSDVRGASILIGAVTYLIVQKSIIKKAAYGVPIICCALAVLLNINAVPDPIKYTFGTMLLAVGLVTMPQAPSWTLLILQSPIIVRFGLWSYSLYLWQQPFAKLTDGIERVSLLPIAFIVALISFYGVERPSRDVLNRLIERYRNKQVHGDVDIAEIAK